MDVIGISSLDLYRRTGPQPVRHAEEQAPTPGGLYQRTPSLPASITTTADTVAISVEARALSAAGESAANRSLGRNDVSSAEKSDDNESARRGEKARETDSGRSATGEQELSEEEQREVQELKQRDAEVRAHERAHQMVGGRYAGAASFDYTRGPDNRRYATGGEVSIDVSPVRDNPEATIQKMQVVKRAALAPAQPSPQDHAVHSQASRTEQQARVELRAEQSQDLREASENAGVERNVDPPPLMGQAAASSPTAGATSTSSSIIR